MLQAPLCEPLQEQKLVQGFRDTSSMEPVGLAQQQGREPAGQQCTARGAAQGGVQSLPNPREEGRGIATATAEEVASVPVNQG